MEFDHRKRYASSGHDTAPSAPAPGKQTLTQGLVQMHPAAAPSPERAETQTALPPLPVPTGPRPTLQMLFRRRDAADPALENEPLRPPSGGGEPLPQAVRGKMEGAFGADFSAVRVHEGAHVTDAGALAYTQGTDIHFARGTYDPSGPRGQELLGHELAHVLQQAEGRVQTTRQAKGLDVNDDAGLEAEADLAGARAARGESVDRPAASIGAGSGPAQLKAASGGVVQMQRQQTTWGAFEDTRFVLVQNDKFVGAEMTLEFDPGENVDASKIGITQSVRSRKDAEPQVVDPAEANRTVKDGPNKGYTIDRISEQNNPIFGSQSLQEPLNITNTPSTEEPSLRQVPSNIQDITTTYDLGHRVEGDKKSAWIFDRPGRSPAPNLEMTFETTALALDGNQKDNYYGSVSWGWQTNAEGQVTKIDLALVSLGPPSEMFLGPAKLWNDSKTCGKLRATKNTVLYKKNGEKLHEIEKDALLVRGVGQVDITEGPYSGVAFGVEREDNDDVSGFVPIGDVEDVGDGKPTAKLPLPQG